MSVVVSLLILLIGFRARPPADKGKTVYPVACPY